MLRILPIFLLVFAALPGLQGADDPRIAALSAADEARVSAMTQPTAEKLDAIFSNDLQYAHSSGVVDSKESFIATLTEGRLKYLGYDYEERKFTFPSPDIALMSGRAKIKAATAAGGMDLSLRFLAVWRLENGHWRFLAWQSCKLPPPPANP